MSLTIAYSDTAGLRSVSDPVESEGIRRALQKLVSFLFLLFVTCLPKELKMLT